LDKKKSKGNSKVFEKIIENKLVLTAFLIVAIIIVYIQVTTPDVRASGEELYGAYCSVCHGVNGVGENPADKYAQDEYGYIAPPMDDSGHAWHHTDEQLIRTILEGSPRNPRMAAWKHVLTEDDAIKLVEYIKSLWSPYIRENCQGPKHMQCM
jgi:mono/diheme cytochrome c family protein